MLHRTKKRRGPREMLCKKTILNLTLEEAMGIQMLYDVEQYMRRTWSGEVSPTLGGLPIKFGPRCCKQCESLDSTVDGVKNMYKWFGVVSFGEPETTAKEPRAMVVGVDSSSVKLVHENVSVDEFLANPYRSFLEYDFDEERVRNFHGACTDFRSPRPPDASFLLTKFFSTSSVEKDRQAVEIRAHVCCRWKSDACGGCVRALLCGTTLDATESYFSTIDAIQKDFCRDIIDHRFGNLLRECQLLLEVGDHAMLNGALELLADEVDIRRGNVDNLRNEPVDLETLLRPCLQSLSYDGDPIKDRTKYWFKDLRGTTIPYRVVQVKVLLHVVSNCIKCGDGKILVARSPSSLDFSNRVVVDATRVKPQSSTAHHKGGLCALKAECDALNLGVQVRVRDGVVTTSVAVTTEPATSSRFWGRPPRGSEDDDEPRSSSEDLMSTASRSTLGESPPPSLLEPHEPGAYNWVIIEDSPMICKLWVRQLREHHGVDLRVLCTPAEVAAAVPIIWEEASKGRRLVVLMDEHLFELTADLEYAPVTGTVLRDRFVASPKLHGAIVERRIHLVSASADKVQDPRLASIVGKHGSTKRMINVILADMKRLPSPTSSSSAVSPKEPPMAASAC